MRIDFTRIQDNQEKISELAGRVSREDLKATSRESVAYLLGLLEGLTDEDVVFMPDDPEANDPYAVEGEEHISWNIAHLIAHVTASSEEGAAFSSLLARGIPAKERPRYETPWREITTKAQCIHRLEESLRIRLAYLETWPDTPHLDVYRELSPRFEAIVGRLNAIGAFLLGLSHEVGHYDQIIDAKQQALAARMSVPAAD